MSTYRRDAKQVFGQEGRQAAHNLHMDRVEAQLLVCLQTGHMAWESMSSQHEMHGRQASA